MINTSIEYKNRIRKNRKFYKKSPLELAIGTTLNLVDADFINDGIRIDDSVGEKVALGTVVINKCTYYLNNFSGKFSTYDFTDAVLRPQIGLQLSETIEYLAKSTFTVDNTGAKGSIIVLEALDNMTKLNTEFSGVTISFPCTNLQLLQAVGLYCGVSLATASFLNDNYIVNERPADEAVSCREIVSWIAQMAGCFARCNTSGAMELKWYDFAVFELQTNINGGSFDGSTPYASGDNVDGGNFTDYTSGDSVDGGTFADMDKYHHIYSFSGNPTIGTDDIVITGIQVTDSAETPTTVLFGTSGYVLPIEGNPLIQNSTQANTIASTVGAKIVGMTFRSFSGSAQSDPSMEAGDVAYASDRKGNSYPILFTSLSYTPGNYEPITCGAETPAKKSYRSTTEMKAIVEARKMVKTEKTARELAIQSLNETISNSSGLYTTTTILPDASKIYYMHDKPTIAESMIIWKMTAEAFAVSTDGGINYTSGMTADGDIIAQRLSVVGIDAAWINVITSFTVGTNFSVNAVGELIAKAGKIGPFTLNELGLFSVHMEFYDDGNYPLIWLRKPGTNGNPFSSGAEGSAQANYEPSLSIVRSIENGIQTEVTLMARTDPSKGKSGLVTIRKIDLSTNRLLSEIEINQDGFEIAKYGSGGAEENHMSLRNNILVMGNPSTGKSVFYVVDPSTGDLSIQSSGKINLMASGGIFANGRNI